MGLLNGCSRAGDETGVAAAAVTTTREGGGGGLEGGVPLAWIRPRRTLDALRRIGLRRRRMPRRLRVSEIAGTEEGSKLNSTGRGTFAALRVFAKVSRAKKKNMI